MSKTVNFLFNLGDTVKVNEEFIAVITDRWAKLQRTGRGEYEVYTKYTVEDIESGIRTKRYPDEMALIE